MAKRAKINQFILYSLCGSCGVLADYAFYYLLLKIDFNYQFSNMLGYFLGTIVSFWLNRQFTFALRDNIIKRFIYFLAVAGLGFIVSASGLWLFVYVFFIEPIYAKVIVIPVVVFIQFSLNRILTFTHFSKDKNDKKI